MAFLLPMLAAISFPHQALAASNIDPNNPYAWSENVGWINFNPSQGGGVLVGDSEVTGYAWGENTGWITMCPEWGGGGCVSNDGNGHLSGYAWGENVGWINFKPNLATQVTIDTNGNWSGYAWGENVGWISFNCSNTSSCGTVNFKVSSGWRASAGGGGGGVTPVESGSGGGTPTFGATGLGSSTPPVDSGTGGGTPTTTPNPGGGGGTGGGVSLLLFRPYAAVYLATRGLADTLGLLLENLLSAVRGGGIG